jgi:hypothetical protein
MKKSGQDNEDFITLVLVGQGFPIKEMGFNNLIEDNIISKDDALNSIIKIQTPDQTIFNLTSFIIEMDSQRVIIKIPDISKKFPARDMIVNILNKYDLYNKIEKIGFNHHRTIFCSDENEWNRIGHKLMPKKFWVDDVFSDSNEDDFGLTKYEVQLKRKIKEKDGHILLKISPLPSFGIEILINDHIIISEEDKETQISAIFNDYFETSFNHTFATLNTFEEKI